MRYNVPIKRTRVLEQVIGVYDDGVVTESFRDELEQLVELLEPDLGGVEA